MNQRRRDTDREHMAFALSLAKRSNPRPNPRVGAVIVKDNEVVGTGFHEKLGAPHAEINAIAKARDGAKGATLYVTLEPCCHHGNTAPCVDAIKKAGIDRVVIGMVDPDGRVKGKGIERLKSIGVKIETGIRRDDCEDLLAGYIKHRELGRPLITLKAATTLDGYIATTKFDSKWISSEPSRTIAHKMRREADAVLVGVNTVIKDDPALTVRRVDGPSPARIVVDSTLRTPKTAGIIETAKAIPTYVAYTSAPDHRVAGFERLDGVELLRCQPNQGGWVDVKDLANKLGEMGILSLLVEGGSKIHGSFIKQKLADRLALFIAPRIIGSGISWNSFTGTDTIDDGCNLRVTATERMDTDLLLRAEFVR